MNPAFPNDFWSLNLNVKLVGAKSLFPPLGLLTVAALLPRQWEIRLVDLNTRRVEEEDWQWAQVVMIAGMIPQREGLLSLVRESKRRQKITVVGGPFATSYSEEVVAAGCDFLFVGEAEDTIHEFLRSLEEGRTRVTFSSGTKPDLSATPIPRFDLVRLDDYARVGVQTSRGCPFDCEFCDVVNMFGRKIRYKKPDQVIAELETLYRLGGKRDVFICDDNFIGSRTHAKEILEKLIPWSRDQGEPFTFSTQVSVNLGQDQEMIDLMTEANFSTVFMGIETPDVDTLTLTGKLQNVRDPLVESINNVTKNGLSVVGSFILGFDGEKKDAGQRICSFVEETSIPLVMLLILHALPNTKLWKRLQSEGRLIDEERALDSSVVNKPNFHPTRPVEEIIAAYASTWDYLYEPPRYLARTYRYYLSMRPTRSALAGKKEDRRNSRNGDSPRAQGRAVLKNVVAAASLIWWQGVRPSYRAQFWRQLLGMWRRNPSRIVRYFTDCLLGENMFRLSAEIRKRSSV